MNKIKMTVNLTFLLLAAVIFVASSLPLYAVQQRKQIDPSEGESDGCVWVGGRQKCPGGGSFIWERLRRRRVPGGSRGEDTEPRTCAVAPGALLNIEEREPTTSAVWSDRPFFFWQGSWSRIEVRSLRSGELMWSQALEPDQRSIIYGEKGKPLQAGRAYYWRLLPAESSQNSLPRIIFRAMEPEERDRITAELSPIEGATAEDTAIARANYFADRELWSDALRELSAVEHPSEKLLETIAQIQETDFCSLNDAP